MVYLDHAATTPLAPAVLAAMQPYLTEHFGNASSVHAMGRAARLAVEESRERIAALLGAEPAEVIFTSGGTEADNAAIQGVVRDPAHRLITSAAEHEAVLKPAEVRHAAGLPVTILTPEADGAVTPTQVVAALDDDVALVSLMHANNEVGTLTDMAGVAAVCRTYGVPLHCDAVQTAGLFDVRVDDLGVDLLSISGHKFNGPKGIGALYVRAGTDFQPLLHGGSQERRRRAGTENVAAIVGLAEALALARAKGQAERDRLTTLRNRLYQHLKAALGATLVVNTPMAPGQAAPHILNVAFPPEGGRPMDGEMLLLNLDVAGVCASSGSACTSGAIEPSHVLQAMGRDRATAAAAVRFSLGSTTTAADVDYAAEQLTAIVQRMRAL